MIRIGIIEYHEHWDYFRDLLDMLIDDDTNVLTFTRYKQLEGSNLDLLFVNSIQDTMRDVIHWLRFKPPCRSFLTVHNVNSMLKFPDFNIRKPIRSLDTLLTYLCMRFIVLPKFGGIIVLDQRLKNYIKENKFYDKPVFVIPFKYHERMFKGLKKRFVVPGRIEEHRRDYDSFLDFIKPEDLVVLLGEPIGEYGKRITERCDKMNFSGYHIHYFKERVDDETYHLTLQNAGTIVFPKVKETHGYGTTKEFYGKTKMVGAYFDAVKYGKRYMEGPPWEEIPIHYEEYSLKNIKRYIKENILSGVAS